MNLQRIALVLIWLFLGAVLLQKSWVPDRPELPSSPTSSPLNQSHPDSEQVDTGAADPTESAIPLADAVYVTARPSKVDSQSVAALFGRLPRGVIERRMTRFLQKPVEPKGNISDNERFDHLIARLRFDRRDLASRRYRWMLEHAKDLTNTLDQDVVESDSLVRSTSRRLHHDFYGSSEGTDVPCAARSHTVNICNRTTRFEPPVWGPKTSEGTCSNKKLDSVFSTIKRHEMQTLLKLDKADDETTSAAGRPRRERNLHPTLEWMRRSRWLLNEFVPFANESSCRPGAPSESPLFAFTQSKFTKGSRQLQKASKELKLKGVKRSYYHLSNVCINSEGGGMSAFFGPKQGKEFLFLMNDIADEKRQAIRDVLFVRNRMKPPSCFIDTPVLIHPLLSQSDNLGHVMYRVLATRHLMANFRKKALQFASTITGFYVTPGAKTTFGDHNMYRVFYQFLGSRWFSVAAPGNLFDVRVRRSSLSELDTTHDLCFRDVYVGWDAIPLYPGKRPADLRRQVKYTPVLWDLRRRILECFSERFGAQKANVVAAGAEVALPETAGAENDVLQEDARLSSSSGSGEPTILLPPTSADQPEDERVSNYFSQATKHFPRRAGAAKDSPVSITIISRRRRRLINEVELAQRIVQFGGSNVRVRLVDFEGMSVKQQIAIASTSDILFGVHGTAMQWALVMPTHGVLVEIQYPKYACTPPGVNSPLRRHCEFGQTTQLTLISHIAFRVPEDDIIRCDSAMRTFCDVRLSTSSFDRVMGGAFCALEKGFTHARRHCDWGAPE